MSGHLPPFVSNKNFFSHCANQMAREFITTIKDDVENHIHSDEEDDIELNQVQFKKVFSSGA
jgi:hypothetical protein